MLIVTILQNFVKLPYLEVTFPETSYFSVLGLRRPIIYRPDDLFEFFCRFCISTWRLTSGKNFIVIHPGTTPPPPFTCKPVSKHLPVGEVQEKERYFLYFDICFLLSVSLSKCGNSFQNSLLSTV